MDCRTCLRLCLVAALLCVAAAQSGQSGDNYASGFTGPLNQQSSEQSLFQHGDNNQASNYNDQQIIGCDTSGVNQQSSEQAIQQEGNGNGAGNGNTQGLSGRRLSDVTSTAYSSAIAGQGVNQEASNSAITETGNGGYGSTGTWGTINCGRRLLVA